MNWLEAFWKKLTAPPPGAARRIFTSPTGSTPPQTPTTGIRTDWNCDPADIHNPAANLTPRAQQVLALAQKESGRLNHNFIGTEHVLLGLITLGQGTAWTALINLGLKPEDIRAEVEKQVGTGPDQKMIGHIPYTPRVRKVLTLAVKEAKLLNHDYVGTEHILLGLLREGGGVAAIVLKHHDIDTEQARAEILKVCEGSGGATEPTSTSTKHPQPPYPKISRRVHNACS